MRGQALKDAQTWVHRKSLSDLDYQFLAASAELDKQEMQLSLEAERLKEVEKNARRQGNNTKSGLDIPLMKEAVETAATRTKSACAD